MDRINATTVEFTTASEMTAVDRFNEALDGGHTICSAALHALEDGIAEGATFSRSFVEYLSEDTVVVTRGGRVVLTPKGRRFP